MLWLIYNNSAPIETGHSATTLPNGTQSYVRLCPSYQSNFEQFKKYGEKDIGEIIEASELDPEKLFQSCALLECDENRFELIKQDYPAITAAQFAIAEKYEKPVLRSGRRAVDGQFFNAVCVGVALDGRNSGTITEVELVQAQIAVKLLRDFASKGEWLTAWQLWENGIPGLADVAIKTQVNNIGAHIYALLEWVGAALQSYVFEFYEL